MFTPDMLKSYIIIFHDNTGIIVDALNETQARQIADDIYPDLDIKLCREEKIEPA